MQIYCRATMKRAVDFQKRALLKGFAALPRSWVKWISDLRSNHAALESLFGVVAKSVRHWDLEIQDGLGKGLRFNAGGSAASYLVGCWQPHTQVALKAMLREEAIFYDVGANVGYFAVIAARLVGLNGKIVCFEPLAINYRHILHNAALNGFTNIQLIETALGNIDAEASFWLSAQPTWGKLVSAGKVPDKLIGETRVMVRRLDRVIAEAGLPPPQVIKIDVEGAEVDVLAGAIETLRRYRPRLLIELHGTNIAVARMLSDLGYKAVVLGDHAAIVDAHWNADVVAIPSEDDWPVGLPVESETWREGGASRA